MPMTASTSWIFVGLLSTFAAGQTFLVTPSQMVTLGVDGDTFGIDQFTGEGAVVLVRPKGEGCTLRFPLPIGDSLFIRTSDSNGRSVLCEARLLSIVGGNAAQFTARCNEQVTSSDPKCPP